MCARAVDRKSQSSWLQRHCGLSFFARALVLLGANNSRARLPPAVIPSTNKDQCWPLTARGTSDGDVKTMVEKKEINCASTVVVRHAGHERSAAASTRVLLPNGRLTGGGSGKVVEQVTLRKWLNGWLTGTAWNK